MRIPFIAGNWKMFKSRMETVDFAREFKQLYKDTDVRAAICAPYVHLDTLKAIFDGTQIKVGAQNVHFEDMGAFTGEVSALMLEEIGVDYCIVGHSERRQYFAETDETVNKKLHKLFETSIVPIMCVGEVLEQREAGIETEVVKKQLRRGLSGIEEEQIKKLVIAYEPVWAIGTGLTASPLQAEEMCGIIRNTIDELYSPQAGDGVIIQYGGSVKPANASEIMNMPQIDGCLVGGASLKPVDFMEIIDF